MEYLGAELEHSGTHLGETNFWISSGCSGTSDRCLDAIEQDQTL